MNNTEEDIELIIKYFNISRDEALTAPHNILKTLGITYDKATDTFTRPTLLLSEKDLEYAKEVCKKFKQGLNE